MTRPFGGVRRVALGVTALGAVLWVLSFAWMLQSWDAPIPDQWGFRGFGLINAIGFTVVGFIVAVRRPASVIGWLLLANGAVWSVVEVQVEYAIYGVFGRPAPLPGGVLAAWLCSWQWTIAVGIYPALLVLFPDGRLSSPARRLIVLATTIVTVLLAIQFAFRSGPLQLATFLDNPITPLPAAAVDAVGIAALAITAPMSLGVAALFVQRFRRSSGVERQQLKWLAYAAVPVVVLGPLSAIVPGKPIQVLSAFSQLSIPVAIAIAVLRYRLYDIDVLINRTLVYAVTTALIAIAFFSGILVLQTLLRPLTNGSEFAVAAATLLSVALFQPLRRRVQQAVDRRFYRSRYDASRTLDAFSARLRDEVDLDAVRGGLLDVVRDTVQPAHAGVWLRR